MNECQENNGGCDSKRKCTNTVGSRKCGKCPSGWVDEGSTGCKGSFCIGGIGKYVVVGPVVR